MGIKRTVLAGSVLLAANAVLAEPAVDVAQPMVCAATEVVECVMHGDCTKGTPDMFNLPVLFKVDIPNKAVESARAGGDKRVSFIASVAEDNGVSVLQGADGAAGWSGMINQSSGLMTFVSSREGVTYSVFGTCASL